jgi:hypothetical protein
LTDRLNVLDAANRNVSGMLDVHRLGGLAETAQVKVDQFEKTFAHARSKTGAGREAHRALGERTRALRQ